MTDLDAPPPARIGPYEVVGLLGRGGMGAVYRARDTRLGREVALKLVHLSADEGGRHRDRLLAETRAAGRLNHPHVMAVLDVGVHDDQPYMVSELIDGMSLRQLLDGGPMPRRRVLDLATQIASGLAAAHEANLVHRDLKPDNVMVTRQGVAKIVDFGLAKSLAPLEPSGATAETLTAPHTVLGTVHYMSPEQARGAAVDVRSDQFAFGAMLYEMLCGRRAFERESPVETLAAILHDHPRLSDTFDLPAPTPLLWILDRCLAKSPEDRYASTADLWHDLKALPGRMNDTPAVPRPEKGTSWRRAVPAAAIALVALGVFAASRSAPPSAPGLPTWRRLTYEQGFVDSARFGADGQTVIYSAAWDNRPVAVFSTTVASPESRALDLPPAGLLAVAPSGELAVSLNCRVVASSGVCAGTLARTPLFGGTPREIATEVRSADFAPDGTLAVTRLDGDSLAVEFPIGTPLSQRGIGYVRVAPDGRGVAWSESVGTNTNAVVVRDANGRRVVTTGWRFISGLVWSRGGDALFVSGLGPDSRDDAVVRVSLDGASTVVLRGMSRIRVLDVDDGGRLLVSASTTTGRLQVWGSDATGRPRDLTWLGNAYLDAIAADGARLLFTVRAGVSLEFARPNEMYPVYVRDIDGAPATRIATGYGVALSPDGRWALTRTRPETGLADLVLVPLGAGEARTLPRGDVDVGAANSPAEFAGTDRVVMRARAGDGPWRTFVQTFDGGPPRVVAHEPGVIVSPMAPDGQRFVAQRGDGSRWISRLTADGGGAVPTVLDRRASVLQWTDDGRGLVVLRFDGRRGAVTRFDIATGRETPLREVGVAGEAGLQEMRGFAATRGGTLVAGSEIRVTGALYLVEGVR